MRSTRTKMPTVVPAASAASAVSQLPEFPARCNTSTGILIFTSKDNWGGIIIERLTAVGCFPQGTVRGGTNIPDHTANRPDQFLATQDMTPDTAPDMVLDTTVRATTRDPSEMSEVLDSSNLSWQLWPAVVASRSCYFKDKIWSERTCGSIGYAQAVGCSPLPFFAGAHI